MRDQYTIGRDLREWMEMSRAAVENSRLAVKNDMGLGIQRTESLLTLSRSLRYLSRRTREYAEVARESARSASGFRALDDDMPQSTSAPE